MFKIILKAACRGQQYIYTRIYGIYSEVISLIISHVCKRVYEGICTFELVPGVENPHVSRDGVKATASNYVNSLFSCLTVVVQLHTL